MIFRFGHHYEKDIEENIVDYRHYYTMFDDT